MNNTPQVFSCIVIYIISVVWTWNWLRVAYSKGGRWTEISPKRYDIFMVFCPVMNTILGLYMLCMSAKRSDDRKNDYTKFFKIKK